MKTVAVLEGWAGGPRLSRRFTQQAEKAGLRLTRDVKGANFIVAHSTGCYMLPEKLEAERILLINPPYWPGESIVGRWLRMNKDELKYLRKQLGIKQFLQNKLWEFFYILAKPGYTWSVLKNQSHLDFLEQLSDRRAILVRNLDDEFCSPKIKSIAQGHKNLGYVEIPGYHADYYINPKPYIDLLLEEL